MRPLVLISGGAGFIGSHTADLLLEKGYRVRILDNLSRKTHTGGWPKYLDKKIEKFKGDVTKKKDWERALKGVSYVIHLAAWMDLLPQFSKFFSTNVLGTANLYEVIVAKKLPIKKVVVASSQFVYGQGTWKCKKHGIVFPKDRSEEDLQKGLWDPRCPKCDGEIKYLSNKENTQDPPNQYAISKYTQELISLKLGRLYGIRSTALRYSIVHGARQTIKSIYSGALRIFALQILAGVPPTVFEDGNQLRDYVSVKDVASANVFVMKNRKSDFSVYNVGGEKAYTVKALVKTVSHIFGKEKVSSEILGYYRVGDIRHAVSDISALKSLGWKAKHTKNQHIMEFRDWINESSKFHPNIIKKTKHSMINLGVLKKSKHAKD